jgi:hypothetical protein
MNILMIALHYHDYTQAIAAELRQQGHNVWLHDIMPRTLAMKSLRVVSPERWQASIDMHHLSILAEERDSPTDVVLFIQAHQMSVTNMNLFRATFASARFILYNWDSISNHDFLHHRAAFDDIFTFDPADAAAHDLHYLPLFCVRTFQRLAKCEQDRKKIYFVGNIVSLQRYDAFQAFRRYCSKNAINLDAYLACTPPVIMRLVRSGHIPNDVSIGSIPRKRFIDMVETSIAVFDFANHTQTGYTMRVFENLCAQKKIITSNQRIMSEAFYTPDRIHVFNDLDFDGVKAFLDTPLASPDENFAQFHIQTFVGHLLEGRGHVLPPNSIDGR